MMSPRGAVYHREVRQRDDVCPGPEGVEQHHTPQNLKSMNPPFLEFSISYFCASDMGPHGVKLYVREDYCECL